MNNIVKVLLINDLYAFGKQIKEKMTSKGIFFYSVNISYDAYDISEMLKKIIQEVGITLVLHTYNWNDHTKAEKEPTNCYRANRDFTSKIAKVCNDVDIPLLYISSHLVFNGQKKSEYTENDETNPVDVLSTSYLQSEQQIISKCSKHIIIRFSWVIDYLGKNFLTNLLKLIKSKKEIVVVSDQQGYPTPTADCARVIVAIIQQVSCNVSDSMWGIFHYASDEHVSSNQLAEKLIYESKKYYKLKIKNLRTIKSIDNKGIILPANAKLNSKKILETFGIQRRPWRQDIIELIKLYYQLHHKSK
jgi:dTDP-4-dehydrorhamnose reductase